MKTSARSIHVSVLFTICFFASGSIGILLSTSPCLQTLFVHFNSHWMLTSSNQRDIIICPYPYKLVLLSLSAHSHMILFCFYSWSYTLNVRLFSSDLVNIFSAVHIFRYLFWKIFALFGKMVITCLKCSRASFSEKMYWERGWRYFKYNLKPTTIRVSNSGSLFPIE